MPDAADHGRHAMQKSTDPAVNVNRPTRGVDHHAAGARRAYSFSVAPTSARIAAPYFDHLPQRQDSSLAQNGILEVYLDHREEISVIVIVH